MTQHNFESRSNEENWQVGAKSLPQVLPPEPERRFGNIGQGATRGRSVTPTPEDLSDHRFWLKNKQQVIDALRIEDPNYNI